MDKLNFLWWFQIEKKTFDFQYNITKDVDRGSETQIEVGGKIH